MPQSASASGMPSAMKVGLSGQGEQDDGETHHLPGAGTLRSAGGGPAKATLAAGSGSSLQVSVTTLGDLYLFGPSAFSTWAAPLSTQRARAGSGLPPLNFFEIGRAH